MNQLNIKVEIKVEINPTNFSSWGVGKEKESFCNLGNLRLFLLEFSNEFSVPQTIRQYKTLGFSL